MIKILIGGSPCTHWSIAQSKNRETQAEGIGWELFRNYIIAKEKFSPDLFLYENNKSAAQPIKDQISRELRVPLQYINSALVSAQNRQRFYVHNFGQVPLPEDRGILLRDIIESGEVWIDKSYALTTRCSGAIISDTLKRHRHTMIAEPIRLGDVKGGGQGNRIYSIDGKSITIAANSGGDGSNTGLYAIPTDGKEKAKPIYAVEGGLLDYKGEKYPIKLKDGLYIIRKLTVKEACRLQTLPDDYCKSVSDAQAYKGLGNGWTAEVIIHLLSYALKDVPKNEKIVVLSMYDGIGTGRYCLDKLGFQNIEYYAYEIDKYAMTIANDNYPDIIQCGDAFQVRENGWSLYSDTEGGAL